ncbi:MAG: LamG domain-containing protein, partial [Actinomycetota bacterium]|nr:LamG domain-containing protein [Actinomycetota bacterium]
MRLLLHDPVDASAGWLLDGLRARGVDLEAVSSEELLRARRWHHVVATDGASAEIALADGRSIDSREVLGAVNRLTAVPPLSGPVAGDDREYAGQELHAFWLSWLAALPGPMLNRPTPYSLCGLWLDEAQWTLRAARAGLPCGPLTLGDAAQAPSPPPRDTVW